MTRAGVIDGGAASVGADGRVQVDGVRWYLDWWIGADDRWREPAREAAVRQTRIGDVPVVQTAMRVPGGDALHRVYGAGAGRLVVEIENASPAPFVVAFVVRAAREVALDGAAVFVDGEPALVAPRAPSRWAESVDATTFDRATGGLASTDPFPVRRDRRGRLEVALLHPVAHRTTLRAAVLLPEPGRPGRVDAVPSADDVRALPGVDAVVKGWSAQLDRGMRVELPDEQLTAAVRSARAELLLAPGAAGAGAVGADVVAALEDWGFDAEAASAWEALPGRQRRRAARRESGPATWAALERAREAGDGPALLLALRRLLVHEADDGVVTLCAELPVSWRGQGLEVHDAPTRRGPVSFAVRWHGPRPALLWDAPAGTELRVPGLDAGWSTTEPRGEALLAAAEVTA